MGLKEMRGMHSGGTCKEQWQLWPNHCLPESETWTQSWWRGDSGEDVSSSATRGGDSQHCRPGMQRFERYGGGLDNNSNSTNISPALAFNSKLRAVLHWALRGSDPACLKDTSCCTLCNKGSLQNGTVQLPQC